jgi:hypothetical protein
MGPSPKESPGILPLVLYSYPFDVASFWPLGVVNVVPDFVKKRNRNEASRDMPRYEAFGKGVPQMFVYEYFDVWLVGRTGRVIKAICFWRSTPTARFCPAASARQRSCVGQNDSIEPCQVARWNDAHRGT